MTRPAASRHPDADSGHWLARNLALLQGLFDDYERARLSTDADSDRRKQDARNRLTTALDRILQDISGRDGATACVVSFEGLLISHAGSLPDFEALAAVSEKCFRDAARDTRPMALGTLSQMVIVGEEHKLVLFRIGAMVLGILSPRGTVLSQVLGE